jgi:hypothetical protein
MPAGGKPWYNRAAGDSLNQYPSLGMHYTLWRAMHCTQAVKL